LPRTSAPDSTPTRFSASSTNASPNASNRAWRSGS